MSTPHIAWAFAQRDLTAAQRVVLIALSERANGERTCFPSEETLATDCELSVRSIAAAVKYLHHERKLIELVTDPEKRQAILAKAGARISARVNVYRILRPVDGAKSAPYNGHDSAKSAPIPIDAAKSARLTPSDSAKSSNQSCKKRAFEHAPFAHEPLNESLHEERGASAPEAQPQDSGGKAANQPSKPAANDDGPPNPPPSAPPAYDPTFTSDGKPRATAEGVHRAAMAAIRALSHREYAPGRAPTLTRNEQIDVATKPLAPLDAPLPAIHPAVAPHVLAARRDLAERAAQRQAAYA